MASTDSSQMNFNPSWMQPTSTPTKGEKINGFFPSDEDKLTHEVIDPVFANHRYGREDILALMTKDVKPPDGLEHCPFFVEKAQTPIILLPLNETELRLQQNINSSKALSVLSRQDRNFLNGSDSASTISTNSKWTVAGGNRNYHSPNKPISNRWSTLGSSTGNEAGGSFRGNKSGVAASLFNRSGTGLRNDNQQPSPPKTFGQRFRHTSINNDSNFNDNGGLTYGNLSSAADGAQSPSTSTSTSSHNPWTKVGIGKPSVAETMLKNLKSGSAAKMLLNDIGPEGGNVNQSHQEKPPLLRMDTKWNYLDPNGVQRGPFDGKQMQAWFENGYFDSTLRVCKDGNKQFITLGELFQINGAVTPFIVKNESTTPSSDGPSVDKRLDFSSQNRNVSLPQARQLHHVPLVEKNSGASIWNNISPSLNAAQVDPSNFSSFIASGAPDDLSKASMIFKSQQETELEKILQEKQLAIAEEQRKLREKEEQLLREERERAEKERKMRKMEMDLERRQEELQRIAREKEEELEKKRLQVAEFERQRREAIEKMEEQIRNEQLQQLKLKEEQRLLLEAENRRRLEKQDAEARQILFEQQRRREQEETVMRAAYEEAQRLKEVAQRVEEEQRKALLAEQEARKWKEREAARIAAYEAQKKHEQEERILAEKQRQEEVERQRRRQMEEELSKIAIEKLLNSSPPVKAKAIPWVTVGNSKTSIKKEKSKIAETRGKSLLEIQQEEEIALRESLKREQEGTRKALEVNPQVSGSWAKTDASTTWGTPAFAPSLTTQKQGTSRSWSSVSTVQPAEIPKLGKENSQNKKASQKKQQQKPDVFIEKPKVPDAFTLWITKRVRELNSSVDAEVFTSFIEGIDSPDEAEDYIIGYLGESKLVKEFHRDFLNKRIELRPRVFTSDKDDLSRPAVAANDVFLSNSTTTSGCAVNNGPSGGTFGANNASKNKKKKGKAQKIDPNILGFRAAGDPNRFNAGEIDTAPPVPSNRKR